MKNIAYYKNSDRIRFLNLHCKFLLDNSITYDVYLKPYMTREMVINNYFFMYDNEIVEGIKSDSVNKIFNSGVEASNFLDYRNKYQRNLLLLTIKFQISLIDIIQ